MTDLHLQLGVCPYCGTAITMGRPDCHPKLRCLTCGRAWEQEIPHILVSVKTDDGVVHKVERGETAERLKEENDALLLRLGGMLKLEDRVAELQGWVDDLQSKMFINCVYCGHRYGPKETTMPTMQQALYDHIAVCRKHPLREALARVAELTKALRGLLDNHHCDCVACGIAKENAITALAPPATEKEKQNEST